MFSNCHKKNGRFVLLKHVGCASSAEEIEALRFKAKEELANLKTSKNQLSLFPCLAKKLKAKLINWRITGFHSVFGTVYDSIGFPKTLLRDLVIARIVYPKSKSATVSYLNQYLGFNLTRDRVYRFLDTLNKDELSQTAFKFVFPKQTSISLVFYDVTTLYFETEKEDDLRKKGYSKDHRIDTPQILVGLFVDNRGYPFDFDFFQGNTFEGHTFPLAIRSLLQRYHLKTLTVVADAAMLSQTNLNFLESIKATYIIAGRLKNLSRQDTRLVLSHDFSKTPILETNLGGKRLLVHFSSQRAVKDKQNRDRLIEKLRRKLKANQPLIRKSKYLAVRGRGKILGIDSEKAEQDEQFDGLKSYLTNHPNLSPKKIIQQYHNLWLVEKAFRMAKSDLRERPIYHYRLRRIQAHLILCFVSLLVMKEAERKLKQKGFSLAKALAILGQIGQGEVRIGKIKLETESELNEEAETLLKIFKGH